MRIIEKYRKIFLINYKSRWIIHGIWLNLGESVRCICIEFITAHFILYALIQCNFRTYCKKQKKKNNKKKETEGKNE